MEKRGIFSGSAYNVAAAVGGWNQGTLFSSADLHCTVASFAAQLDRFSSSDDRECGLFHDSADTFGHGLPTTGGAISSPRSSPRTAGGRLVFQCKPI